MNDLAFPKTSTFKSKVGHVANYYNPRIWQEKGFWWTTGLFLITATVIILIFGVIWSRTPDTLDVKEERLALVNNDANKLVTGTATTAAAIGIAETLLDKPGGYLSNDIGPPGISLDNILG